MGDTRGIFCGEFLVLLLRVTFAWSKVDARADSLFYTGDAPTSLISRPRP